LTCKLCGLDSGDGEFCCAGCRNVHAILLETGALTGGQDFRDTDLYRESLRLGLISNRARTAEPAIPPGAELREAVFHVEGMWCASCGWLIEHALGKLRGVAVCEVMFASDLVKLRYAPQYLPLERVRERVAALGYRASEYTGEPGGRSDAERKDLLLRTGLAALLWMNAMMFSLVVYASYFVRITGAGRDIPFVLMALATPTVFYCAWPILRLAWAGVRAGALRMETLLAMGILAAYFYSVVAAFSGSLHVYFDTVCAIVTLVLAGKSIERASKERSARAIALLYRLMPNKARLVVDGRERFVSLEALKPGMRFLVKSGERIAADGIVWEGRSHADESVLTGESRPVGKAPGDTVVCGSVNTGGPLEIEATRVGQESTLAHIVRTVESAARNRTHIEHAVDRVSRVFVPLVLALSFATLAFWIWRVSAAEALAHAIAVLVIACPCALGIATPLALTAAVAAASRRGILVGDTRVLETIRGVDVVVLDKTGTATEGAFALLEIVGDSSRMAEIAAVEARSEHPLAKAIVARGAGTPAALDTCVPMSRDVAGTSARSTDISIHPGMGISGVVDGTRYFIGNSRLMETFGARVGHLAATSGDTGTVVYFGWEGAVRGAMAFGDRVRPDARELCAALGRRRIRSLLLSGDAAAPTQAVAASIGASEWEAEATPERKVETIRRLRQSGAVVMMIGDGVNDAPSLAEADLGIALGCGADIAIQAAPLVLMNNKLGTVIDALDLSRRVFGVVRQNLFWAFAYNTVGVTLAFAGIVSPILAASAMVLSSLSVIGNSRRLG
jgi:heavy metal translocating P-type ATPase